MVFQYGHNGIEPHPHKKKKKKIRQLRLEPRTFPNIIQSPTTELQLKLDCFH